MARNTRPRQSVLEPDTVVLPGMQQMGGAATARPHPDRGGKAGLAAEEIGAGGSPPRGRLRDDCRRIRQDESARRRPRIALYSHDTLGLGHLRRNLLIAQALSESPLRAIALLITGAHEANFFSLPAGVDCMTLPRLHKDEKGRYSSGQLDIPVQELACLRADSICSALSAFRPDVMIVDKIPTGAFGEMLPTLQEFSGNSDIKCVLGLRDVLDDPDKVRSEWLPSSHQAIEQYYDELWVYGDRQIYDPIREYGWHEGIADKVRYTGYLDQASRLGQRSEKGFSGQGKVTPKGEPLIICALGGGQDGFPLAEAFLESLPQKGATGIVLAGPFMPAHLLHRIKTRAAGRESVHVLEFTPEADHLIRLADRVVAMGGYNTVCAILSFGKPALLVPRVSPRSEQWIRAQRLAELGFLDVIHPVELTPAIIREWIESDIPKPPTHPGAIDLAGIERIPSFVAGLVSRQVNGSASLTPEFA